MMLLGIFDFNLGEFVLGLLRIAVMGIIYGIYWIIAAFYNLFIYMTKINLLAGDNQSLVSDIYNRIQVILAVVMVFYVTLEFVKYIVNPETFSDKEKGGGGLLKRVLVVIVLMAFTPRIFGMAYDLQGRIINSEVIPKILIKDYDPTDYDDDAGGQFSANLLSTFYKPYKAKNGMSPEGNCDDGRTPQKVVDDNLKELADTGDITNPTYCIDTTGDDLNLGNGKVKTAPFLIEMGLGGLFPIALGLFMVWVLINYCAEAGRVIIQFVFLQIIAPIPILSYLAPGKDGMFQKWTKQCVTTYLDMFIRLFIMYLVMLLSSILLKFDSSEILGGLRFEDGSWMPTLIILFLIVGLCLFALKAPKMVKELLPGGSNAASGDFGFKARELPKPVVRAAGATLGAGYGMVKRGMRQVRDARAKNKEIKDQLRAQGMPTNGASFRKAQKNARRGERNARKMLNKARRDYDKYSKKNNGENLSEYRDKFDDASKNYVAAANEKSKYDVLRTRSKILSGVGGAIYGATNGVVDGVKIAKVSELHKTFSNVNKSVNEKTSTREKWAEAGAMNIFERTKAKILAASPNLSEAQLVKQTLDRMKNDAQSYERIANQNMQAKSAVDEVGKKFESKLKEGTSFEVLGSSVTRVLQEIENLTERDVIKKYLETLGYDESVPGAKIEVGRLYKNITENADNKRAEVDALAAAIADPKNSAHVDELKKRKAKAEEESLNAKRIVDVLQPKMTEVLGFEMLSGLYNGQKMTNSSISKELLDVFARFRDARNEKTIALITENLSSEIAELFKEGNYEEILASLSTEDERLEFSDNIQKILKELKNMSGEYQRNAGSINSLVNTYGSSYATSKADALRDVAGNGGSGKR